MRRSRVWRKIIPPPPPPPLTILLLILLLLHSLRHDHQRGDGDDDDDDDDDGSDDYYCHYDDVTHSSDTNYFKYPYSGRPCIKYCRMRINCHFVVLVLQFFIIRNNAVGAWDDGVRVRGFLGTGLVGNRGGGNGQFQGVGVCYCHFLFPLGCITK